MVAAQRLPWSRTPEVIVATLTGLPQFEKIKKARIVTLALSFANGLSPPLRSDYCTFTAPSTRSGYSTFSEPSLTVELLTPPPASCPLPTAPRSYAGAGVPPVIGGRIGFNGREEGPSLEV